MLYQKLAEEIYESLQLKILTHEDEHKILQIDKELKEFVKNARPDEIQNFQNICFGLEAFAIMAAGIEHDQALSMA